MAFFDQLKNTIKRNVESVIPPTQTIPTPERSTQKAPFLFSFFREQVEVLELGEKKTGFADGFSAPVPVISLRDDTAFFGMDGKGAYFFCNSVLPGEAAWVNGELAPLKKKIYLVNEDVIVLQAFWPENSRIYLYTIQNQMETGWSFQKTLDDSPIQQLESGELFVFPDMVKNLPDFYTYNPSVYSKRNKLLRATKLLPYQSLVIDDRHFLYDGLGIYVQDPLKVEEHRCLTFLQNDLSAEDCLSIDIRKRMVNGSGSSPRKLLEDIRLDISAGEMVLILGGSGAGKTTFFNAVMGTEKADATIMIGPRDLYRDFSSVKRMLGYVPQQDTLRMYDTVYMTLKSTAQMKLSREFTADPSLLENRIYQVLTKFGIQKEADTLVSKLSGGQRKRLCIAMEYIAEPAVFFLDEPDSGLDGNQGRLLMQNLRAVADDGKIVLVISHAPDRTLELFDKVIVLAKSQEDNCGKLAFYGSPAQAQEFFQEPSLEKIVGLIEKEPDLYIQAFKKMREE